MAPPFWLTGTIRKSTTRIESTRKMSLSWCGVEWRAETDQSENLDRTGRRNQFDIAYVVFGKETCGEPEPTMSERTGLCSFQILLINSRLKRDASLWPGAQLPKSGDRFVASVCGGTRDVACFVIL